jgi:hypothetical protein
VLLHEQKALVLGCATDLVHKRNLQRLVSLAPLHVDGALQSATIPKATNMMIIPIITIIINSKY